MIALALALLMVAPLPTPAQPSQLPNGRIAKLLATSDGRTAPTAFKVRSVHEEYEILAALGLELKVQSLVMVGKHPYDVLAAVDPATGAERELWFDIKSFYGRELGF